jgi:hypothetical protein
MPNEPNFAYRAATVRERYAGAAKQKLPNEPNSASGASGGNLDHRTI